MAKTIKYALIAHLFAFSLCAKESKPMPRHFGKSHPPAGLKAEATDSVSKKAEAADQNPSETGHYGHDSKYYMYAHVPEHDHYEFGYKRGNEHHYTERHEKAHPYAGQFKTKVRWGDAYGGYGERYYDYNHAGHDDHGGDESHSEPAVVAYEAKSTEANAKRYVETDRMNRPFVKRQNENEKMLTSSSSPHLVYDHEILKEH